MQLKNQIYGLLLIAFSFINAQVPVSEKGERHFVIVTGSYNNATFCHRNLDSVFNQKYENWHIIYTEDCSTDNTYELVKAHIAARNMTDKVTLIKNTERRYPMANHYNAVQKCKDTDIIVILDGDDWFADDSVLSYLNNVYSDPNIWLTYGQFHQWPTNHRGWASEMPEDVVKNNSFREYTHAPAHLRTFYAGLFKQIKKEDLMYEGNFVKMTADNTMMFPMIEMARDHFKCISKILMIYNAGNPISEHLTDDGKRGMQQLIDKVIRSRPKYEKIESPFRDSENVAIDKKK